VDGLVSDTDVGGLVSDTDVDGLVSERMRFVVRCCAGLGGCVRLGDEDVVHRARIAAGHVLHVSSSITKLARTQSAKSCHVSCQNQR